VNLVRRLSRHARGGRGLALAAAQEKPSASSEKSPTKPSGGGAMTHASVHLPEAPAFRADVDAIYAQFADSLRAGDADAWAALWTEDGIQMPPDAPSVSGRTPIRETMRAILGQFDFDMEIQTEEAHAAGDWGFARGTYTATLTPKQGGSTIPIDGKFVTILAHQVDGSWKVHRDIFNSNVPR
jgi:uncharacterized protein (TIGR02246 family)